MPIEIRITDINNLTTRDIDQLYNYLMTATETDEDVLNAQGLPSYSQILKIIKEDNEKAPCEDITLCDSTSETIKPKTRKKQMVKHKFPLKVKEVTDADEFTHINEELEKDEDETDTLYTTPLNDDYQQEPKTDITYEELIAFVLENTRTKKLEFDKVMTVVGAFNIPNLNSLDQFPHLIAPVYKALKDIVENEN